MLTRLGLVAALLLAVLLPAATAPAAPRIDPDDPSTQIDIVVESITPQVVKSDSTVKITGTLRNRTASSFEDLIIRLQSGDPLTSRDALHTVEAADSDFYYPTPCEFARLPGTLGAHANKHFTVQCSVADLGMRARGVYPLMVNLNGTDVAPARIGELRTFLPYFPKTPEAPTKVSWLWPIVDEPHRDEQGIFRDDSLADRFAPGGQLYRRVHTALDASESMPLTLAIDPELVESAMVMREDYPVGTDTDSEPGTGTAAATQWLADLADLAHRPNVKVIALPYADPDVVALYRAELGDLVGRAYVRGAAVLAQPPLNIEDPEKISWPAAGALNEIAADGLPAQNVDTVILDSESLPAGDGTAVAELPAPSGAGTIALLADHILSDLTEPTDYSHGTAVNVQRFLAELAVLTAGHPQEGQSVLITPPRRWQQPPAYSRAILDATASVPWVQPQSLDMLAREDPTNHGPLEYPTSAGAAELRPTRTDGIREQVTNLESFAGILTSNTDKEEMLTPYYDALLRASSSAWRGDADNGGKFFTDVQHQVRALQATVFIVPPSNGTYSLASSDSPLLVTVENQLDVPVKVEISITALGSAGFRAEPFTTNVIEPHKRDQSEVPAKVERSGSFKVRVQLSTPDGQPLGESVPMTVRSTAYGTVALGITAGALFLLLILVARRLVLRIKAARAGGGEPDDSEAVAATDGEFAAEETPASPSRGDP